MQSGALRHRDERPAGSAARLERRRARRLLLVVSGAAFLDFLDVTVVNLAFPEMRREFGGASVGDVSWVITGYAVAFAALLTPAGRLADVAGRRRLFLAGTVLFGLASLTSALAPSLGVLVGARFVQGAAAAMTLPAGLGIVLAATPVERRTAAIGIWGAAAAVAALVGPTVGGVLVDTVGWRAVFLVNLPVGALILIGTLRLVGATPRQPGRAPDLAGTVSLAAGIGLVVLAVTQVGEWGVTGLGTIPAATGGAALVVAALLRSRRHPSPAVEVSLWRIRQFSVANVASLLMGAAVYAWMLVCVLYLTAVWGYSELEAGLAMSPGAFSAACGAAVLGRRMRPGGQRAAVAGGSALLGGVGLWLVLSLGPEPQFVERWLPAGLLAGVAMAAMGVGISSAAATAVTPDRYAAATGLNLTARQVGGALGVALLAAILEGGLPGRGPQAYLDVFLMCSLAALAAGVAAVRLGTAPVSVPAQTPQEA